FPRRQRLAPRRAGGVLQQPVHPFGRIASPPAAHREHALAHSPCHRDRAIATAPKSKIRDRHTIFCGVLRSLTSLSSRSQSSGGTWMRSILPIQADSHPYADLGILWCERDTRVPFWRAGTEIGRLTRG